MIYTIFSINETRAHYKIAIRNHVPNWDELVDLTVDASDPQMLEWAGIRHPYAVHVQPGRLDKIGQLGIWYSVLNAVVMSAYSNLNIVTFEDDAILHANFVPEFHARVGELPEDTDFFAMFLPRDQDHVFEESMSVSPRLCQAYQRYGGVSMYYTPQGARKILALLQRDGLTDQYDDQLFKYVKAGELNGYTSKPYFPDLVYISGEEISIVQESEKIDAG